MKITEIISLKEPKVLMPNKLKVLIEIENMSKIFKLNLML